MSFRMNKLGHRSITAMSQLFYLLFILLLCLNILTFPFPFIIVSYRFHEYKTVVIEGDI